MSRLLHIDTSIQDDSTSTTRRLSRDFARTWRDAHPAGEVEYLDLGRHPPPHILATDLHRSLQPVNGEPTTFMTVTQSVRAADTIVIGTPMYNYTIPSSLKSWLDRLVIMPNFADPKTGESPLGRKKIVVITGRGGSYAPGTPKHAFDFQMPYLQAVFTSLGLAADLTFVHAEMTLAAVVPQLHQFKALGEASLASAHADVERLAKAG